LIRIAFQEYEMEYSTNLLALHRLVWVALLAALTAAGAFIAVPLGPVSPVPVTLQTMFVLLAGLILGPRGGAAAMLLYLAAGCLGLPVFAGGKAGLAVLLGPTGGFLLGFAPAAMLAGLARRLGVRSLPPLLLYCAAATSITLVAGTAQLMLLLDISLSRAIAVGVAPFLPGGALKCLAAAGVYRYLRSRRLLPDLARRRDAAEGT
jgi:biotin transport system substrate-specific component